MNKCSWNGCINNATRLVKDQAWCDKHEANKMAFHAFDVEANMFKQVWLGFDQLIGYKHE